MWHGLFSDASFYAFLQQCDADIAAAAREDGCRECGGRVDSANYERRPRGGPAELGAGFCSRLSFCCAARDCRKRLTPPSLRFLGRKVYLGAVVALVTAMRHGPTPRRVVQLRAACGVSERTILRWRQWWCEEFAKSEFFTQAAGRFATLVEHDLLPLSLLERFAGEAREKLLALLNFIAPITTCSAPGAMGF